MPSFLGVCRGEYVQQAPLSSPLVSHIWCTKAGLFVFARHFLVHQCHLACRLWWCKNKFGWDGGFSIQILRKKLMKDDSSRDFLADDSAVQQVARPRTQSQCFVICPISPILRDTRPRRFLNLANGPVDYFC